MSRIHDTALIKMIFGAGPIRIFCRTRCMGVLAEYIVGMALDCIKNKRLEWDAYDLVTADGIKIEVKSAAYIQTWHQAKHSDIRFDVAEKRSWSASTNTYSKDAARRADIYSILCPGRKTQN